jgi:hypothetical protein
MIYTGSRSRALVICSCSSNTSGKLKQIHMHTFSFFKPAQKARTSAGQVVVVVCSSCSSRKSKQPDSRFNPTHINQGRTQRSSSRQATKHTPAGGAGGKRGGAGKRGALKPVDEVWKLHTAKLRIYTHSRTLLICSCSSNTGYRRKLKQFHARKSLLLALSQAHAHAALKGKKLSAQML